jgi:hypothetical protein
MISRKRFYDVSERVTGYLMDQAAAIAFPGREQPLPPVLLIALPKSGSVYLQRALRRTLRVPVHHIASAGMGGATFRELDLRRFAAGNVVAREHLQPRPFSLRVLARHGIRKIVLHLRDPRAAMVSWTRHLDRVMTHRGFRSAELWCELALPDAYAGWTFEQRLRWQVENKLPDFVRWIEDWLALAAAGREVEVLVTDYAELERDARRLITRILEFNGIAYDPEWISLPSTEYGKNNIYSILRGGPAPAGAPSAPWRGAMPQDVLAIANTLLPADLAERFGWPKP